ncbi:hypothetical protein G9A89_000985 [Geosiphon pyriformis]|nr:hypothetical protein G9A89_000985 [Geosiphon pyriformis]
MRNFTPLPAFVNMAEISRNIVKKDSEIEYTETSSSLPCQKKTPSLKRRKTKRDNKTTQPGNNSNISMSSYPHLYNFSPQRFVPILPKTTFLPITNHHENGNSPNLGNYDPFHIDSTSYIVENFPLAPDESRVSLHHSMYLSIRSTMPHLPSDRITDICEIDFPTELRISTFYQLRAHLPLLGPNIYLKCVILRMLSFREWNARFSFKECLPKIDIPCHQSHPPSNPKLRDSTQNIEDHLKEQFNEPYGDFIEDGEYDYSKEEVIGELTREIFNDQSRIFLNKPNSPPNCCSETKNDGKGRCNSRKTSIEPEIVSNIPVQSKTLEIVVQGDHLSPQSDLLSKVFFYLSKNVIYRAHPYGRYMTRVTLPMPSVETIEPIINWLYGHDDRKWMDTMTPRDFLGICQNVAFLELHEEAYEVLLRYVVQCDEKGIHLSPPERQ